jgi:RNA polymerase sigma-70 factor (ECF subfamily)
MTDEQIIIGLRDKDPAAFDAVYTRYYRQMCLFANSLLKDEAEAKDVASDAFMKLWEIKAAFTGMTHVEGFLCLKVKHSAIDRLRSRKVRMAAERRIIKSIDLSSDTIERNLQEAQIIQKLYVRISELPERSQLVFKLINLEDRSRSEVAQLLNISENTVRNLNAAATKALRLALGKEQFVLVIFLAILILASL